MDVNIVQGDILQAETDVIIHQVNCQGVMGAGLALQIRLKYPDVYKHYQQYCTRYPNSKDMLGHIQSICVGNDPLLYIVNLFAQDGLGYGWRFTNYDALKLCLVQVNIRFKSKRIAVPYKMSCGLAGGDWNVVSKLIEDTLTDCKVTYYKYTPEVSR